MNQAIQQIKEAKVITFLTGAGVSVPSGIPDYRSMDGVYQGYEHPEYLLSHTCLTEEPQKFYSFVKRLYHPEAQPNLIHQKIAELQKEKQVTVVTQNIDQLHHKAGSTDVVDFHGNLYDCYCMKCGQQVRADEYLRTDCHEHCGGRIRPRIVLYEEGLDQTTIERAVQAVQRTDVLVIVGTSFQVHPFCDLIFYKRKDAKIIAINKEKVQLPFPAEMIQMDAEKFFEEI